MNAKGFFTILMGSIIFLNFLYALAISFYFEPEHFSLFLGFSYLSGSLPLLVMVGFLLYYYRGLSKQLGDTELTNTKKSSSDIAKEHKISLKRYYFVMLLCLLVYITLSVLPGLIYHHYIHPLKPVEALAMVIIAYINAFIFAVFITYIEFSGKWIELL